MRFLLLRGFFFAKVLEGSRAIAFALASVGGSTLLGTVFHLHVFRKPNDILYIYYIPAPSKGCLLEDFLYLKANKHPLEGAGREVWESY